MMDGHPKSKVKPLNNDRAGKSSARSGGKRHPKTPQREPRTGLGGVRKATGGLRSASMEDVAFNLVHPLAHADCGAGRTAPADGDVAAVPASRRAGTWAGGGG